MIVEGITVGPLAENCWIVADESTRQAAIIDPGYEGARLLRVVDSLEVDVRAIWLTHAHIDHVGAVGEVFARYPVPIYLHPADRPFYDHAHTLGSAYGMNVAPLPADVTDLAHGDELMLGETAFGVHHFPGHSPGSVAFVADGLCFSGDLLFEDSIGRTDLPLSSPADMHRSLQQIATFPGHVRVFPGHGGDTTIARELASNPFLRGVARPVGA